MNPPETPHARFRLLSTGLFHERAGYRAWRTNGTDDWLLILTVGGHGRFGHAGGDLVTSDGDLVLIKPNTRHDYGVEPTLQRWDLLWSHFHTRPHWIEWLDWPVVAPGILLLHLDGATRKDVTARFHECHTLASGARRRHEELAMTALEGLLLAVDAVNPKSTQSGADDRVLDAMDYACRNLSKRLTLDDLADAAGLSVSRFAHLFREQTGSTPQGFVEQQRIAQARQLLELSSRSVKQIARDVGFDTQVYFSQRFKKVVGVGPRQYRRNVEKSGVG
jgi:AraC family transcriptional regulator of arabinose operon